jgi:hypothetical protein
MKVSISLKGEGYEAVFEGSFSMAEFLSEQRRIILNTNWETIEHALIDLTNADLSQIRVEDTKVFAAINFLNASSLPGHNLAFVATDSYMVKLIESYRRNILNLGVSWNIEVFSTLDEARNWIISRLPAGGDTAR